MTAIGPALDLARIASLHDFEPLARLAIDERSYDYIAGGSWDDLSLAENQAAWRRRTLRPRVLVDVADVTTETTLLGAPCSMPVAIAPMAYHGLAHAEGEVATARAAAAAGVPFILSTMSTRSIEEVAAVIPEATRWFQLYVQADPRRSRSLVERAAEAGYSALVVTADVPVLGYRERDLRSGFQIPPLGNFAATDAADDEGVAAFSRSLTWGDLATIRSWAPMPLVLKGILTPRMAGSPSSTAPTRSSSRTTAPVSSIASRPPSMCSRRSPAPSAAGPRSGSMAASGAASTSRSPSASGRAASSSVDPRYGRWRRVARRAWSGRWRSSARSSRSPSPCSGRRGRATSRGPTSAANPRADGFAELTLGPRRSARQFHASLPPSTPRGPCYRAGRVSCSRCSS